MRPVTAHRFSSLYIALVICALGASCSSNTTKAIKSFADKVCACKDAACALSVQESYLAWWKDNQRARGSDDDRKDIEKAMQRYAECHQKLVGDAEPAPSVPAPKVDLTVPAQTETAPSETLDSEPPATENQPADEAKTEPATL